MSAAGAPETWGQWTSRIAGELTGLAEGEWLTITAAPDGARRPVSDVFLQARLLEGVLALECISDTEFEGLSDLSAAQEQALVALGWEQQGSEPAFERTYPLADAPADENPAVETATEAADLLRQSLEQVLGALSPDDVVLRRSSAGSSPG